MSGLVVDIVFRDQILETVPFDRPTLRVGRMPENELAIDNLGVSRFHARLQLEAGRVFLEDAGSENGCMVNDERVVGRREIAPGDRIAIGKHELRVRSAAPNGEPARRARRQADGFDGARTHVAGMPGADAPVPIVSEAPAAAATREKEVIPMSEKPSAPESVPVTVAATASPGTSLPDFDFDFVGALAGEPEVATVDAAPVSPAPEVPVHAGFIVQHEGRLERIVAWRNEQIVAGRAADCDIVLGIDEVSRRHARFERVEDRFEVCDLGSVNGTFVNGRRVERQALAVGDVVQIEGFKLTFVLDRKPIDEMVAPPAAAKPPAPVAQEQDRFAMTMLQEEMPQRPGFTELLATPSPVAAVAVVEAEELPAGELFPEELDDEVALIEEAEPEKPEEQVAVPLRGSSRATSVQDLGRASQPDLRDDVVLELRVRVDLLPPALRAAFEAAGASDLVLPAEIRLKS